MVAGKPLARFFVCRLPAREEPFRIPKETASVASFGAKGDGKTDATAAFKQAIAAGAGKVVTIPSGRFVLSVVLEIRKSNLVLRGVGPDKTVLLFTKPLEELRPRPAKTDGNQPTSGWSWGGGLIMIGGKESPPARSGWPWIAASTGRSGRARPVARRAVTGCRHYWRT